MHYYYVDAANCFSQGPSIRCERLLRSHWLAHYRLNTRRMNDFFILKVTDDPQLLASDLRKLPVPSQKGVAECLRALIAAARRADLWLSLIDLDNPGYKLGVCYWIEDDEKEPRGHSIAAIIRRDLRSASPKKRAAARRILAAGKLLWWLPQVCEQQVKVRKALERAARRKAMPRSARPKRRR